MRSLKKMIEEVRKELYAACDEMVCLDGSLSHNFHRRPLYELMEINEKKKYLSEEEFYELGREWRWWDDCMYTRCADAIERVPSERIDQI